MPRFYFDLTDRAAAICDDFCDAYSHEYECLEDAKNDALEAAVEFAREGLRNGEPKDVQIDVKDAHRQRVLSVTILMKVDRVGVRPVPPPA